MRRYEKIIKDINFYCLNNQISAAKIQNLKYDIDTIQNRSSYAYLKAKGYINLVESGGTAIVERLDSCVTYQEDKNRQRMNALANWSMNITIAAISALFGAVLARISLVLFP